MTDLNDLPLSRISLGIELTSRSQAICVGKMGSQIKGCVVDIAQTRTAQSPLRLHRLRSDYTTAAERRCDAVLGTTTPGFTGWFV